MRQLPITVHNVSGIAKLRPVTGGAPIAEGAAPKGGVFALHDSGGKSIPLQTSVLAQWKDGSARWVLLDFQSNPPVNGQSDYVLSWGTSNAQSALESGGATVSPADDALLNISERLDLTFTLTDSEGQVCNAVMESYEVETAGELRSTLSLLGSFRAPAGERVFQFRMRASTYAGLSMIRLEPLILVDADSGIMRRIRELKLSLKPRQGVQSARLGGDPGWSGAAETVRLFQYDDQNYKIQNARGGKAPGWASVNDGQGEVAVALRDFWRQWPKSLEISSDGVSVGLFPAFKKGDYAHMEPWYKYQYLFDGDSYRIRVGQARRWDIWLDLDGNGESLAKAANAPLVPSADPVQAIAAGVWDAIAPAGTQDMGEYDKWAENLFDNYCYSIEAQRDYGAMNWGDWFGERKVNWGNHEYDTTNQILIQFARTGDPKYLYAADAAARHSSEVDTVHHVNDDLAKHFGPSPAYPARPGLVHQHTVGHVSGFYSDDVVRELFIERKIGRSPNPYLCLSPFNLGHIWTQGLVRQYFLTGDPFLKETVEKIGDNLAQLVEDREFKFMGHTHCGRTT